jgi:hypothetical protein
MSSGMPASDSGRIGKPLLGNIQFALDQRLGSTVARAGGEDADLTVIRLAQRPFHCRATPADIRPS